MNAYRNPEHLFFFTCIGVIISQSPSDPITINLSLENISFI